jgi:lipid-binding SYLF domain-containing protein
MRAKTVVLAAMMLLSNIAFAHKQHEGNLAAEAQNVLSGLPADLGNFLKGAHAYVVYPHVGEGGFIVGGKGGHGIVYEHGSAVGTSKFGAITFGAQVGGKSYDEIVVIENEPTFLKFRHGELRVTAEMSGVVGTESAAMNAVYHHGVVVFTLNAKGLYGGVTIEGQVLEFHPN